MVDDAVDTVALSTTSLPSKTNLFLKVGFDDWSLLLFDDGVLFACCCLEANFSLKVGLAKKAAERPMGSPRRNDAHVSLWYGSTLMPLIM